MGCFLAYWCSFHCVLLNLQYGYLLYFYVPPPPTCSVGFGSASPAHQVIKTVAATSSPSTPLNDRHVARRYAQGALSASNTRVTQLSVPKGILFLWGPGTEPTRLPLPLGAQDTTRPRQHLSHKQTPTGSFGLVGNGLSRASSARLICPRFLAIPNTSFRETGGAQHGPARSRYTRPGGAFAY